MTLSRERGVGRSYAGPHPGRRGRHARGDQGRASVCVRWAMNGGGSPLLSVRAEARQLVAPDYAVVDGLIEYTGGSKAEAMQSVTASLDRLIADLSALGAVPFDEGTGRSPLTWSAHSSV